jgi:hypothetical protein
MTSFDYELQRFYWYSQILLPVVALLAGWIALRQSQTFRLIEMVRHIERPEVRAARRIVMTQIAAPTLKGQAWWSDERLHEAAAQVCASYDHLGAMMRFHGIGRVERWFINRWGEGVVRTHDVLLPFLEWRRRTGPQSYIEYTWLYERAKKRFPNVLPPEIPFNSN